MVLPYAGPIATEHLPSRPQSTGRSTLLMHKGESAMHYRKLGNSELNVSAIGLGCMSMSGVYGKGDDTVSESVIQRALELFSGDHVARDENLTQPRPLAANRAATNTVRDRERPSRVCA